LVKKKKENGDFWSVYFLRICEEKFKSRPRIYEERLLEMLAGEDWKVEEGKTLSRDADLVFRNSIVITYKS